MFKIKKKNLAIAVDVGGTNLRTALIDEQGKIYARGETKTARKGKSGLAITHQIISEILKILSAKKRLASRVRGIGVSVAGPIDPKNGVIVNPPNMKFKIIPIVEPIRNAFHVPVSILNDCKAGALGEKYFGVGKKSKNLVYITISSGIGGGAIIDGRALHGKDGNASEVGHMLVDTCYNLACSCKFGRGHWEAYASGKNLPKFFRAWIERNRKDKKVWIPASAGMKKLDAKEIFELAQKKNPAALAFMKTLGKINGRGISNVIAAYDPEMIVFGGAVALNNFEVIMKYAKPNVDKFLRFPIIAKAKLGDDAPLLGAAARVMNQEL